jgi:hypothetical protein
LARNAFLRSEIKQDYTRLCNHSRQFTQYPLGDDVSKSAKELEHSSKISEEIMDEATVDDQLVMRLVQVTMAMKQKTTDEG